MLVGHELLRHQLAAWLPQVTLIEGPEGVGKRLVAREAAGKVARGIFLQEVGVEICVRKLAGEPNHEHAPLVCDGMTTSVARYVVEQCLRSSVGRAFVFDVGRASMGAVNTLLKVLEKPPPRTYFVMYASSPVYPTIASRAARFRVAPLRDDEVEQLLRGWQVPAERAARAARLAAGRPGAARVAEDMLQQKGSVLQLLRAATEGDMALLANALRVLLPANSEEWSEVRRSGECHRARNVVLLFRLALSELRTRQFRAWDYEDVMGLELVAPGELDKVIAKLGARARPELTIRSAVEKLAASRRL